MNPAYLLLDFILAGAFGVLLHPRAGFGYLFLVGTIKLLL